MYILNIYMYILIYVYSNICIYYILIHVYSKDLWKILLKIYKRVVKKQKMTHFEYSLFSKYTNLQFSNSRNWLLWTSQLDHSSSNNSYI